MLFHSGQFALFLVVVLLLAALLARWRRLRHLFLLAASCVFYGAWDPRYLELIFFTITLDYLLGRAIHRATAPRRRKLLLAASLVSNLGILAVFKYYGFFVENLAALLRGIGLTPSLPMLQILLPVGISFFTFQSLSYTIDIYRRVIEPQRSFVEFALFVTFFPQLVAGPIVRAREFLPQLVRVPAVGQRQTASGIFRILEGLTKKVLLADMLGLYLVDIVFGEPGRFGAFWVLAALYGFRFQIYNDFAGYSDIAIGSARLLGYELPENFRAPYKAVNIADHWRRWHVSLGSWFRDYLYLPLGDSRGGVARTCLNLLLTFGLIGLWHGASWTFVLWGLYYGVLLCLRRLRRQWWGRREGEGEMSRLGWIARVIFVFHLSVGAILLFRSPDLGTVGALLAAPWREGAALPGGPAVLLPLLLAALLHYLPERWKEAAEERFVGLPPVLQGACAALVIGLLVTVSGSASPYYYFQF